MTESEYLRFMISQKPTDYPEMRILLRELINEVKIRSKVDIKIRILEAK